MAQYYQVTSLEELHRLYPDLQLDSIEGIQCTIQDDQVTQYTDGQGQQIIATVEHSAMQLPQNSSVSQQCSPQQPQFVVQQPTQYVIQQMEGNDHGSSIQYIQQRHQLSQKKDEVSDAQFKDSSLGCLVPDGGNEENTIQQHVVKQDNNNQQFVSQVQPILHQPVQIHQAVDMGPNILVLHNQEQQDVLMSSNKRQELVMNQNQQDKQQQQHIVLQRQQQNKSQQVVNQKPQIVQKEDTPSQSFTQQQVLQGKRISQSGGQQPQIFHHPQEQIIQQLQYYNQVAVLDGFSQPNVTIDHHVPSNENLVQPQPVQNQEQTALNQQQYKQKKNIQQAGLSNIQQPQQLIIPQRFDLSSPPPLASKVPQPRKKGPLQEVETTSTPVFIVQKLDSPFLIRQPQTKIRFQSPNSNSEKVSLNSYHSISTQQEHLDTTPRSQQHTLPQSRNESNIEVVENMSASNNDLAGTSNKFSSEKNQNREQVKIDIAEQPFGNRLGEQVNKTQVPATTITRTPMSRVKTTEQQTEPVTVIDGKEMAVQPCEKIMTNTQTQSQSVSTSSLQLQPSLHQTQSHMQNDFQIPSRGRGVRIAPNPQLPRGGHQYVPRARGVPVQTSPPRPPHAEESGIGRRLKSPRGGIRGGRGGWVPCGLEQRQPPPTRPGTSQTFQAVASNVEASQNSNESTEEARMVVLLLNGEKKMVKIPCSQQNIFLGQILQQAGLSLSSPASLAIEHVADTSNAEQFIIKSSSVNNQQQKTTNVPQSATILNPGASARSIVTSIQPQRFRGHSPRLPQVSGVGIIRHRLQFTSPRVSSPSSVQTIISTNAVPESGTPQSQTTSNPTPTPPKEEPRFVSGCMAICPFCGISSLDFNKCIRCRRKLPENVKSQAIFCAKKKKVEKASTGVERTSEDKSESEEKQLHSPSSEDRTKSSPLHGYDKKKPKCCPKKKKINDEPAEILILSSDEEEETKSDKTDQNQQAPFALKKEPVYLPTELSEGEMNSIMKESNLNEELMKNVQPGLFTTLQCRTVRVGSYKVQPKERIFISTKAIRLVINSLKNENATIVIPITNILKALIHFGKQIPVIFIYPLPKVGFQIRNILGMEDKLGPYYDPTSTEEETHKRITLLLEKITEDNKITLNKIFGQGKLEELSEKEANEILIRASAIDLQNTSLIRPTDSVRKIMVYPPPPEKGGITLNNQDYACLGEDQFLNDVIIDFYLKYLLLKVLSPEDRNRTHVFSTFFYKRLTTKPKTMRKNDPENDPKLSPAEKRHMRVKGWTKQVNLFEKDFIIVPINEHSHWFLAIICFPGLTGPVRFSDNSPVEPEDIVPKKNTQTVQIGNTTITHILKSDGNTISLEMDSGSDRDEAEGDQDDLHPSSEEESDQAEEESNTTAQEVQIPLLAPLPQASPTIKDPKVKPVKRKPFKEPIKQPCILIFDSLAGASRVRVVATLRDYLKIEYKKKMGQERDFSKDTIKGAVPKVPQQNNFTDCGLYVLQYVESFFQDPLHDFKLPLKYLQDWFPEEVVSSKRQKLASLIRTLMEEQGIRIEEIGLPVLTFTSGNTAGDQSRMDEEEEDEDDEMNEEDEELLRRRVQISEFDNEDEDDMDLGEEEEDDDDDLDDDDEDDEELEVGEIPRRWIAARSRGSCNELESSVEHVGGHIVIKTLVDYDPSDSDEEDCPILSNTSETFTQEPRSTHNEIAEEGQFIGSEQTLVSGNRKSVPLAELQDFESQISCTTIERNFEGKNSESDMMVSEEEEEECGITMDEDDSFETSNVNNAVSVSPSFTQTTQSVERRHFQHNEVLEVTDIIKKLVNDKNITIRRKEEELDTNLLKKHMDVKKFKVKDCDKSEQTKNVTSPCATQKNNLATCKRSYQALKSVRIPKKAEREVELTSKRQKLDER